MNHNVYWRAGHEPTFAGLTFDDWQTEMGQDRDSLLADPKFVDVAGRDFHLRPDSPAFKVGFQQIDTSTVGLVGPSEWVELPKKIQRPPTVFAEWIERNSVRESFEETPVGKRPAQAAISGADAPEELAVTDQTAAGGKQSLKVSDAKGLAQPWHPHFFYKPSFLNGTVQWSLDLRLEKGAMPWIECRDADNPYRVGPSVRINAQGELTAGGKTLTKVPLGEWFHLEARFQLGKQARGTYDLSVTLPGGEKKQFPSLPFGHKDFKRWQWFGFMSMATDQTTFYVDNIQLDAVTHP
jgi:hypothetical protein